MVVVGAVRLDEQVERSRRDHDMVDFGQLVEFIGDGVDVAVDPDADHCLAGKAELCGIGDRHDRNDPGPEKPVHPLAYRRLREADRLRNCGVRSAAILLQLLDNLLREVVEPGVPSRGISRRHGVIMPGGCLQRQPNLTTDGVRLTLAGPLAYSQAPGRYPARPRRRL